MSAVNRRFGNTIIYIIKRLFKLQRLSHLSFKIDEYSDAYIIIQLMLKQITFYKE